GLPVENRGPGLRVRPRVVGRDFVLERILRDAREPLGEVLRQRDIAPAAPPEIRRLDDQRVAFPTAARRTEPLRNRVRQRRTPVPPLNNLAAFAFSLATSASVNVALPSSSFGR